MIISNAKVIPGIKHSNSVINIFHFDNNHKNHFASLSEDGQLIEWGFDTSQNCFVDMGPCTLVRPSEEILTINKHKTPKLKKNDFIRITKSLLFKTFIALGYEDGLITVYEQNMQNWEQNANANAESSEQPKEDQQHQPESPSNYSCYSNYFSLYFILLGHTQKVTALHYVDNTNMLVTASDTCIIKIYSMENGNSLYHFNLDCVINYIFYFEKKKDKYIGMICQEPYKLVINITKEPLSFNHFTFKYNNITQVLHSDQGGFYLLGKTSVVYYFDAMFEYKEQYEDADNVEYTYMCQYKKDFCIFDVQGYMRYTEINKEKKAIITVFKIKIGDDMMNTSVLVDASYFMFACGDGKVYADDIEQEIELYWQRKKMLEEEMLSNEFNKQFEGKKGKKGKDKGKGKGNNDKDKLPKIKKDKTPSKKKK